MLGTLVDMAVQSPGPSTISSEYDTHAEILTRGDAALSGVGADLAPRPARSAPSFMLGELGVSWHCRDGCLVQDRDRSSIVARPIEKAPARAFPHDFVAAIVARGSKRRSWTSGRRASSVGEEAAHGGA